eukprot:TRINITY_DN7799_c0_g1_i3.p1 TRINITY_DN7799_c0_g1~~TRINITY_DN7799_c0_g1_i3.p1  ORF type:complete len:253 (-),score=30.38 TRINITY_DN7799_c0_g1_i3:63-821(-)
MIRRPPRSTQGVSSAASDVYKRQYQRRVHGVNCISIIPSSLSTQREILLNLIRSITSMKQIKSGLRKVPTLSTLMLCFAMVLKKELALEYVWILILMNLKFPLKPLNMLHFIAKIQQISLLSLRIGMGLPLSLLVKSRMFKTIGCHVSSHFRMRKNSAISQLQIELEQKEVPYFLGVLAHSDQELLPKFLLVSVFMTKKHFWFKWNFNHNKSVSYTHLRAHETSLHLVCRLLLEKKKKNISRTNKATTDQTQ